MRPLLTTAAAAVHCCKPHHCWRDPNAPKRSPTPPTLTSKAVGRPTGDAVRRRRRRRSHATLHRRVGQRVLAALRLVTSVPARGHACISAGQHSLRQLCTSIERMQLEVGLRGVPPAWSPCGLYEQPGCDAMPRATGSSFHTAAAETSPCPGSFRTVYSCRSRTICVCVGAEERSEGASPGAEL